MPGSQVLTCVCATAVRYKSVWFPEHDRSQMRLVSRDIGCRRTETRTASRHVCHVPVAESCGCSFLMVVTITILAFFGITSHESNDTQDHRMQEWNNRRGAVWMNFAECIDTRWLYASCSKTVWLRRCSLLAQRGSNSIDPHRPWRAKLNKKV